MTGPAGFASVALTLLLLALPACARSGPAAPAPVNLDGQRVMLLPVRLVDPAPLNAELAFWLGDRSPATDWILPDELQRAVDRAPAWRVRLDALPRAIAGLRTSSPHLEDPAYGELRRLAALVDATLALMPVSTRQVVDGGAPALELTVALVDVRGGQVLWLQTVRGDDASGEGRGLSTAAAEALARVMFPSHSAAQQEPD